MRTFEEYEAWINEALILPEWYTTLKSCLTTLERLKHHYEGFGVPWEILAVLHMREASNDLGRQLLNGEYWGQRTTMIPKDIGPFPNWRESTWYAIVHHKINTLGDSPEEILRFFENWNGWGYIRWNVPSPYVWSGTTLGLNVGKYVIDGIYSSTAEDMQPGAGTMYLLLKGVLSFEDNPLITIRYGDESSDVERLQTLLIKCGNNLKVDGDFGPQTAKAFHNVFGVIPEGWDAN